MHPSVIAEPAAHGEPKSYLRNGTTIRSWLLSVDHKRIAILYLCSTLVMFLLGGIFALMIRIELLTPGPTLVSAQTYNRLFTLHGLIMVFLFLIPAIPAVFGNFFIPIMIGAKDVAFPKLNLLSWYIYILGAGILLWAMIHGGLDTGWTFYEPYSNLTQTSVSWAVFGVFVVGFSSILTGLNFIVTVHTLRAPGITWHKLPLFVWGAYATSLIQVLATPVLGLVMLLVASERVFGFGFFNPAQGGDPILFQHLFWFYSHPAVYITVLPAFGVISEVVCATAHKNIFGYKMVAYSSVGIALVGFFAWGHHLFTSGESAFSAGAFGAISMFVGLFTAIKVFNWTGTLYKGSISINTPFIYFCGFIYFVIFGGMSGIALATVGLDSHWQDTYFVVAHFHFIMVAVVLMAFLAGLHYWFPKMFGKKYPEGWGIVGAFLVIFGFNGTFLPQFLLGNEGMPRRYYEYPARFQALNVASTLGASIIAIGLVVVAIYLVLALVYGEEAERNPWASRGYEWIVPTPPPTENFDVLPNYNRGPHEYDQSPDPLLQGAPHAA